MSRLEFKQFIFADLNTSAVIDLLGSVTVCNARVYFAWPQEQPALSNEPTEPGEGWLTYHEKYTPIAWNQIREDFLFEVNIFATRVSVCEQVLDVLDDKWHWKMAGHNSRCVGSGSVIYNVLFSQRLQTQDFFAQDGEYSRAGGPKLYRKQALYQFAAVKVPFKSGAS
jgi:hypothetical protein